MFEDNAETASRSSTDTAPPRRRKRVDGRFKPARQAKALATSYVARGAEPRAALRAAELEIIASEMRAKQLRGEPIDVTAMLKAEGVATRAVRALCLADRQREPKLGPDSLRAYAAAKYGATV
jgi:hypothetical protein